MREMKDSGVPWIGEIPKEWTLIRGKNLFRERSEKGNPLSEELLSPTQKYGVIPQSLYEEYTGAKTVKLDEATDFGKLKAIHKGDFCISLRSFQGGFEYSRYEGVLSPAYHVFYAFKPCSLMYFRYMFKEQSFIDKMCSYTLTLRDGKNISFEDFGNSLIPLPPCDDQQRIADFLDTKCAGINDILEKTRASIEEYKKLKQSVITEAVTKGIRENRPMKDSGVEWIGKIPAEWEYNRLKFLFTLHRGYDLANDLFAPGGRVPVYGSGGFMGYHNIVKAKGPNIIIGRSGSTGKLHYITQDFWPHNTGIYVSDFKGNNEKYVFYVLSALDMSAISTQTAVPTLDRKKIQESFLTFTTSIKEQQEIAAYLDEKCAAIDSLIASKEALITELETYKKSLIYEYVTGKKEVPESSHA